MSDIYGKDCHRKADIHAVTGTKTTQLNGFMAELAI